MDDYTSRTPKEYVFSWITLVCEIADVMGEELPPPRKVLEHFADVLEAYYPNFGITVSYTPNEDHPSVMNLVTHRGYDMSTEQLERLIKENEMALRPHRLNRHVLFISDLDHSDFRLGNVLNEGAGCHIPIVSRSSFHGWITLYSQDKNFEWSEKDRRWLPALGHLCGSYVALAEIRERESNEKKVISPAGENAQNSFDPSGSSAVSALQAAVCRELTERLTKREGEILELIAQGHSNNDIARKLYISTHTVKKHLESIYAKLEVENRTQASLVWKNATKN